MHTFSLPEIELDSSNERQIINMDGPWIGTISTGGHIISEDCVLDNFLFDKNRKSLFFIKYHLDSKYKWFFTINFYQTESRQLFKFDKQFDMIYLRRLIDDVRIEFCHSFHGKSLRQGLIFDVSK